MSDLKYIMITVAKCDAGYLNQALKHTGGLAGELKTAASALMARYGVISTGEHAGSLILFQGYDELNGVDRALDVYGQSDNFNALMESGKLSVVLRNIVRVEDLSLDNENPAMPSYGVLTRFGSPTPMTEKMAPLAHLFEENGVHFVRYGTIVTGSNVGRRLLGAGYPSMDAIEKTYEALRASKGYADILGNVDLDFRNIFRYVGEA